MRGAKGVGYRRLEKEKLGNRKLPNLRTSPKKRAQSQPSGSIMKEDMADRCRVGPQRPSCSTIAMSISR